MRENVSTYVATWNELDAAKRPAMIEQCCSEDFRIVTGGRVVAGRAGLAAMVTEFRSRFPAGRVSFTSRVEAHPSGSFRMTGAFEMPDGTLAEALDAGECDEEGRIRTILTFVGALPEPP